MAKATATCKCAVCGKSFDVSKICYNRKEANNWESWAENHYSECPECYKVRMEKERAAANIAAVEKSNAAGLPILTGSEKQISWASKIRQDFLDEYLPLDQITDQGRVCLFDFLNQHSDSKYWIENRRDTAEILKQINQLYAEKYA